MLPPSALYDEMVCTEWNGDTLTILFWLRILQDQ